MSVPIQNSIVAVTGLTCGTFGQLFAQWKGRGIELLTNLSTQMHRSPLKALSFFVLANGLFYAFVTHQLARYLNNRFSRSNEAARSALANVVVIPPLTILFNIALAKLTQYQISRITLLMITAAVIAFRLLSDSISASTTPSSSPSAAQPMPLDFTGDENYERLTNIGFTGDQLTNLVRTVGIDQQAEVLREFSEFCSPEFLGTFMNTPEKHNSILQVFIDSFNASNTSSDPTSNPMSQFNEVL